MTFSTKILLTSFKKTSINKLSDNAVDPNGSILWNLRVQMLIPTCICVLNLIDNSRLFAKIEWSIRSRWWITLMMVDCSDARNRSILETAVTFDPLISGCRYFFYTNIFLQIVKSCLPFYMFYRSYVTKSVNKSLIRLIDRRADETLKKLFV